MGLYIILYSLIIQHILAFQHDLLSSSQCSITLEKLSSTLFMIGCCYYMFIGVEKI